MQTLIIIIMISTKRRAICYCVNPRRKVPACHELVLATIVTLSAVLAAKRGFKRFAEVAGDDIR